MICHTTSIALFALADGARPAATGWLDHDTVPVRCHWQEEADAPRCPAILDAAARAWAVQVEALGFAPPMPDDDGVLDFYLTEEGTYGGAYTLGPYEDEDRADGRMGCHAYVALDRGIPDASLPLYVAHEFNHVLQFGMDFTEPSYTIWEATASASEVWTFPGEGLDSWVIQDFQADPWLGLLGSGYDLPSSEWSLYEYGAVLWILHLADGWAEGSGEAGAELWWAATQTGWTNEPDVLDAYDTLTGDWRAALLGLSLDRAWMGTEHAPPWAAAWSHSRFAVAVAGAVDAAALPASAEVLDGPAQTGVVYVEVTGLTPGEEVVLQALGGEVDWGLVVADGADGDWADAAELAWTPSNETLLVGVVHLGAAGFDGDDRLVVTPVTLRVSEDGAAPADSGQPAAGGAPPPEGCGCETGGGLPLAGLGLLLVGLGRRRSGVQPHHG